MIQQVVVTEIDTFCGDGNKICKPPIDGLEHTKQCHATKPDITIAPTCAVKNRSCLIKFPYLFIG